MNSGDIDEDTVYYFNNLFDTWNIPAVLTQPCISMHFQKINGQYYWLYE